MKCRMSTVKNREINLRKATYVLCIRIRICNCNKTFLVASWRHTCRERWNGFASLRLARVKWSCVRSWRKSAELSAGLPSTKSKPLQQLYLATGVRRRRRALGRGRFAPRADTNAIQFVCAKLIVSPCLSPRATRRHRQLFCRRP